MKSNSVTIFATCPPGLEDVAAEEVFEVLQSKVQICVSGNIRFDVSLEALDDLRRLRCIERLFAVVLEKNGVLSGDRAQPEEDLEVISSIASDCQWGQALTVWANFCPGLAAPLASQLEVLGAVLPAEAGSSNSTSQQLRFRLQGHRAGPGPEQAEAIHGFTSLQAAGAFGGAVAEQQGWKVALSKGCFDIDLCLQIRSRDVHALVRLTTLHGEASAAAAPNKRAAQVALSKTALRSSLAAIIARLRRQRAEAHPAAELVLDPMCGCGSLGAEVAAGWPSSFVVNGDICSKDVEKLRLNALALESRKLGSNRGRQTGDPRTCPFALDMGRLEGLVWDASRLPLRNASMDSLLTDLPWGRLVGSREQNRWLYPAALREAARVLRPGGSALFLTKDKGMMALAQDTPAATACFVQPLSPHRAIKSGDLRVCLFHFVRSTTEWSAVFNQESSHESVQT